LTARIKLSMSDAAIVRECRQEMDAALAISGGGAYLECEPYAAQAVMRLIVKQADTIHKLLGDPEKYVEIVEGQCKILSRGVDDCLCIKCVLDRARKFTNLCKDHVQE